LAGRYALRDAARQRSRTAPAVAAVLVAVAAATGGAIYATSQATFGVRTSGIGLAPGGLLITSLGVDLDETMIEQVSAVVHGVVPDAGTLHPVTMVAWPDETLIRVLRPDSNYVEGWFPFMAPPGLAVDDGSLTTLLGIPDAERAAAALASGKAVVQAGQLWPDGTAHISVQQYDPQTGEPAGTTTVTVPAVEVGDRLGPISAFLPIIPPGMVGQFGVPGEARAAVGALVAMPAQPVSHPLNRMLDARLQALIGYDTTASLGSSTMLPRQDQQAAGLRYSAIIAASAAVVALAAAWIAAALAAIDSRADLATLSAVGTEPRTRRRIVSAQAGIVALLGTAAGAVCGLAIGAVFVLAERHWPAGRREGMVNIQWTIEVPWPVIGAFLVALPLVAMGAAWLATRAQTR
jgi:putative ABC transport system permease protein